MPETILLIKELLSHVEAYKKETGNNDLKEFSLYLNDKLYQRKPIKNSKEFDKNDYANYKSYAEVEFSTLLTNLYRFAKHYLKKSFHGTPIKTLEEFGFLATLLREKNLLKNELISRHLLEISSGSEILKRLIKNGLIQEMPDEKDKRAKRVSLTKQGFGTIMNAFDEMHKISEIIVGKLSNQELKDALNAFNKLNYFHQEIYDNDRNLGIDELHKKYIEDAND